MSFPCKYCLKIPNEGTLPSMQRCGRCKAVYYCSRECQTGDWGRDHRELCKIAALKPTSSKLEVL